MYIYIYIIKEKTRYIKEYMCVYDSCMARAASGSPGFPPRFISLQRGARNVGYSRMRKASVAYSKRRIYHQFLKSRSRVSILLSLLPSLPASRQFLPRPRNRVPSPHKFAAAVEKRLIVEIPAD